MTAVLAEAEEDEDFTESDKSLRISLIKALAHYGDEASPAMGALVNCLKTGESRDDERRAALQTLSLMGPSAVQAVTTAVEKHEQQVQEYKAKPKPTDMASLLASILPPGVSRDSLNRLMQLQQTANIVVRRIDGKDGQVTVGPRQIAIGLATWCPDSKNLIQFLSTDSIKEMTRGFTFDFIFGNEWPFVESRLTTKFRKVRCQLMLRKWNWQTCGLMRKTYRYMIRVSSADFLGRSIWPLRRAACRKRTIFLHSLVLQTASSLILLLLNGRLKLSAYRCGSLIKSSGRDI